MSARQALVVITGGGSGIGAACAKKLAARPEISVLVLGRNQENLKKIHTDLGPSHYYQVCDLLDPSSLDSTCAFIRKTKLPVQALINNAGIFRRATFLETDLSQWRSVLETNLMAPVELSRRLLPLMIQKRDGSILNISSTVGERPVPGMSAYAASKAALINWTKCLALEMAPHNIRVNCICPGVVDTPILSLNRDNKTDAKAFTSLAQMHPLGRIGSPDDVAQAAEYFLTSTWTTGAVLDVDGGINL